MPKLFLRLVPKLFLRLVPKLFLRLVPKLLGVVVAMFALAVSSRALAQQNAYSKYEQEAIDEALHEVDRQIDPNPQGKTIEEIRLRRLDVFEERDPLPHGLIVFLDWFHATSRPFTIERELLFHEGDTFDQATVDETARNLRGLRQLSLVIIVPVVGSKPDRVRLIVITKDIWSLRLNSDIRATSAGLERLLIQPSEENLGGTHHSANLLFLYEPDVLTFGFGYKVPRIGDSRLAMRLGANVIVNQETGDVEGTSGLFSYGQPLYSTSAKWSYIATLQWLEEIERRFKGVTEATFDAKITPEDDKIPNEYEVDEITASFNATRSFGQGVKHDVSFGAEAERDVYRAHQEGFDPRAKQEFIDRVLPLNDTRVYPYALYETYDTRFQSVHDHNTLGLQEDVRLGHNAYLKLYPVLKAFASSRNFMGIAAGLSYTVPLGDGLARVYGTSTTEFDGERVFDGQFTLGARLTTPRFYIGRLVFDALWVERYENYLNKQVSLGGSSRLRGYPSGAFIGESAFAYNFEYRTRPLEIFTIQAGFAAFWDTGATFDRGEFPDLLHSVGVGLRVLFPQLDRTVFRLDWAFPLVPAPEVGVTSPWQGDVVFTFDQAFSFPSVSAPSVN
ncbi:MAG: hypothetical protein U0414_31475 [Polyangiaceae bacterium]